MQDTSAPTQAEAIVAAARWTTWNSTRLALLGTCKLLALGGMIVGAIMLQRQETVASSWVAHTVQVLATVASLDANLKSAISGERGYVIGRDPADHEASEAAERQVDADLATLRALTADDPAQMSAVADLDRVLHRRLEILRRIAAGVAALPPRVTPDHAVLADANASAAEVGRELQAIRAEEQRRLAQRQADVARTSALLWGQLLGCGAVVAAGVFLMSAVVIGRRREQRHVTQLEHLNALLETRVLERTQALAASESRLRIYFENSATGILVLRRHADGRITHDAANPAYLDITGLTDGMLSGRAIAEIWPDDVATAIAARVDACLRTRQAAMFTVERRLRGETCVLDISVAPVREGLGGDDGELVVACVRDMTRERRLTDQVIEHERARAEAAEREAAVFENSADVLAVIGVGEEDGETRFVYEAINPAFEAIGGPPIAGLLENLPRSGCRQSSRPGCWTSGINAWQAAKERPGPKVACCGRARGIWRGCSHRCATTPPDASRGSSRRRAMSPSATRCSPPCTTAKDWRRLGGSRPASRMISTTSSRPSSPALN